MYSYVNANTVSTYAGNAGEQPIKVQNGSVFHEMDTGLYYMYDAENDKWLPQIDNAENGGKVPGEVTKAYVDAGDAASLKSANVYTDSKLADYQLKSVTVTVTQAGGTYNADLTYVEIQDAFNLGKEVAIVYNGEEYRYTGSDSGNFNFSSHTNVENGIVTENTFSVTSADVWTFETQSTDSGVTQEYVDTQDNATLQSAKDYAQAKNLIIYVTKTETGFETKDKDGQDVTYRDAVQAYKNGITIILVYEDSEYRLSSHSQGASPYLRFAAIQISGGIATQRKFVWRPDGLNSVLTFETHNTYKEVMVVEVQNQGGNWSTGATSAEIRDFQGVVILKAEVDGVPYVYLYQRYDSTTAKAIFTNPVINADIAKLIEVTVDFAGNVERMDETLAAVTFVPQVLTPEQQNRVRKNINANGHPVIRSDDGNRAGNLKVATLEEARLWGSTGQTTVWFMRNDLHELDDADFEKLDTEMLVLIQILVDDGSGKNKDAYIECIVSAKDGQSCSTIGVALLMDNKPNIVKGIGKNAEAFNGISTVNAVGENSHAEGLNTTSFGDNSHVQGKFNIPDTDTGLPDGMPRNKYAHIVGNGTETKNSNAHTVDWNGNSWYQGNVLIGGTDMDAPDAEFRPDAIIIKSSTPSSAKRFKITIDDTGTIKATEVV